MSEVTRRLNINTLLKSLRWAFIGIIIGTIIGYVIFTATLSQPVDKTVKSVESQQTTEQK